MAWGKQSSTTFCCKFGYKWTLMTSGKSRRTWQFHAYDKMITFTTRCTGQWPGRLACSVRRPGERCAQSDTGTVVNHNHATQHYCRAATAQRPADICSLCRLYCTLCGCASSVACRACHLEGYCRLQLCCQLFTLTVTPLPAVTVTTDWPRTDLCTRPHIYS